MRVLGVRHHSPACAGLVGRVIRESRPAWVLIEGPADFNYRLHELSLGHELPVAIFSYRREPQQRACWTPFCDYSPEWVALQAGREVGARVLFIDLPGWSRAFEDRENRFADRQAPDMEKLAQRMGFDDTDRLWDSMFEQPRQDLEPALRTYFEDLRATLGEVSEPDRDREQFMASSMAWAAQQGGEAIVVCGGYHAPFLERAWKSAEPREPVVEAAQTVGNFLIPFTFQRLDSFAGYQSGMPSPAYHQNVWEGGLVEAARRGLSDVALRLRKRKQSASSADMIVAQTMAEGLARLRGHAQPSRTDVLDGLAASLLKNGLDVDLPWSRRGTLQAGSDPVLVEIVAAFSGERKGRLAVETPRPPLVWDAFETIERLDLKPTLPARKLNIHALSERPRSAALHRLSMLSIPGFQRVSGPKSVTREGMEEVWRLEEVFELESALIEASHYGPDLASACLRRLEEGLEQAESSSTLARLLSCALFADLPVLSERALSAIPEALQGENSLADLGQALTVILEIYQHDSLLGGRGKAELATTLEAGFSRGLWLFEGLLSEQPGDLEGLAALRDVHRSFGVSRELAVGLMRRAARDPQKSPALQGGAVGFLWTTEGSAGGEGCAALAAFSALQPAAAADFLVGLLRLAREEVLEDVDLVRGLDSQVRGWSPEDFLLALPALRLAFAELPPQDKERLGRLIATLYGKTIEAGWLRLEVAPHIVARGHELEARLDQLLSERGLG